MRAELTFDLNEPVERERHKHATYGLNYWRVLEGVVDYIAKSHERGVLIYAHEMAEEMNRLAIANSAFDVKTLTKSKIY